MINIDRGTGTVNLMDEEADPAPEKRGSDQLRSVTAWTRIRKENNTLIPSSGVRSLRCDTAERNRKVAIKTSAPGRVKKRDSGVRTARKETGVLPTEDAIALISEVLLGRFHEMIAPEDEFERLVALR